MKPNQSDRPSNAPISPAPPATTPTAQPNTLKGSPGLQITSTNPSSNQGTSWQHSKIVWIGGGLLYLLWAAYVCSAFKIVGAVILFAITFGIFITYKISKKTNSLVAQLILKILIGIVILFMAITYAEGRFS